MTVVVGYVPNAQGEAALAHAAREAQTRGMRLVVVNSSRGDATVDPGFVQDQHLGRLREILTEHRMDGKYDFSQPVRGDDAAEEVLAAAEEHNAVLVVIGMRRRSAVSKFIMGSTAQRILLEADCPVLAVKATH